MFARLRPRLTYANVIATMALFLALGGGAYAAASLPANSVGTKQLKDQAVTLTKISSSAQTALRGHNGRNGLNGKNGTDGQNGSAVVDRARSTGPVTAPSGSGSGTPVQIPLTSASWTQQAQEVDQFVGRMIYTPPASCGSFIGAGTLQVDLNGQSITSVGLVPFGGSGPQTTPLTFPTGAFEPGTSTARTLTATVTNNCSTQNSGQDFTINSLAIDVIAAR